MLDMSMNVILLLGERLQTLTEVGRAVGTSVGSSVGTEVLYFDKKLMIRELYC